MNWSTQGANRQSKTQGFTGVQTVPATILLVEDEPAVRMVTREALELAGYNVLEADGPAAAVRIAGGGTTAIDLLLTDMIMPGMNGAELARTVRQRRPTLVTLFMTGYADSEALRLATVEFKRKHIQKPFTVHGLLARVAEALASRWNGEEDQQSPQHPSP